VSDHDDDFNRVDDDLADDDLADGDGNAAPVPTAVDVLEYVVKSVVNHPDGVSVEVDDRRSPIRLDVHVADGDMGRVVGKRGRTAQAIRTVVRAAAHRDGAEVDIEFVD
jgi:predicted RNA-binding protein YlqC (UPF0109 family)